MRTGIGFFSPHVTRSVPNPGRLFLSVLLFLLLMMVVFFFSPIHSSSCSAASHDDDVEIVDLRLREIKKPAEKFSVIIPTFKRMKLLTKVLENYCKLPTHIDTIIVVWNDINTEIPSSLKEFSCDPIRIVVKKSKVNSLHNRFLPYHEIRTEAVLSSDDDLLISHHDLDLQFDTWQHFRYLLVGFAARRHIEDPPGSGKYKYVNKVSFEDPRYSFILTTSAMFHVKYLELYHKRMPAELRQFVDKNMNCEDILINAIIAEDLNNGSHVQQCPALLVEQKDIKLIERQNVKGGYGGLWHRKGHKAVREKCFELIAKHFHGIPFEYSALKVTHVFPEKGNINFL